jgi:hypothetical protein
MFVVFMKCSKRVLFFIIILYLPNGLSIDLMWIAEMGKNLWLLIL